MTIFPYYKKAINGIYTIFKHTHMLFFGEKGCLLPRAAMSHNIWTPSLHCDNYIYIHNLFESGLHDVKIFRARRSFARRLQTVIVDAAAT